MSAGASKDYNFGQKNHWRRTLWNEVLRRTNGSEKTRPILYLAGPQDNDRKIATSKGVPGHNLIAIDRDRSNVAGVRSHKGVAIESDMLDLLWSWPDNHPVSAVIIDLCCGFEVDTVGMYDALERPAFDGAVCAVNMQRGRDSSSNGQREMLDLSEAKPPIDVSPKHRGWQYLAWQSMDSLALAMFGPPQDGMQKIALPVSGTKGAERYARAVEVMVAANRPKYLSYKSGAVVFDSVVFEHPVHQYLRDLPPWIRPVAEARHASEVAAFSKQHKESHIERRITAAMAVRTMRSA